MTLPNKGGQVKEQKKSRVALTLTRPAYCTVSQVGGVVATRHHGLTQLIAFFKQRAVQHATQNTADNRHHPEQPQLL